MTSINIILHEVYHGVRIISLFSWSTVRMPPLDIAETEIAFFGFAVTEIFGYDTAGATRSIYMGNPSG
jgi:hypothetical protein